MNDGRYRKVDLDRPCHCSKCGQEIVRDGRSADLVVNVHESGLVFCRQCKRRLNEYAGGRLRDYERKLVKEFLDGC